MKKKSKLKAKLTKAQQEYLALEQNNRNSEEQLLVTRTEAEEEYTKLTKQVKLLKKQKKAASSAAHVAQTKLSLFESGTLTCNCLNSATVGFLKREFTLAYKQIISFLGDLRAVSPQKFSSIEQRLNSITVHLSDLNEPTEANQTHIKHSRASTGDLPTPPSSFKRIRSLRIFQKRTSEH